MVMALHRAPLAPALQPVPGAGWGGRPCTHAHLGANAKGTL